MSRTRAAGMLVLVVLAVGAAPPPKGVDRFGDPLPYGAVARLGTVRMPNAFAPLVFLPGGKFALSGARLIDVKTGAVLRSFDLGHDLNEPYLVGACSADGKLVALWASGGALRVWKAETGEKVFETRQRAFPHAELGPSVLAFSPDNKHLSTGGSSVDFTRWDLGTGKVVPFPKGIPTRPRSVRVAPDGRRAALVDDEILAIWDLTTGKVIRRLGAAKPWARIGWSPDGKLVAFTNSVEGAAQITLHDADADSSRVLKAPGPLGRPGPVFSPDGKKLAVAGHPSSAFVWDVNSGAQLAHFKCEDNGGAFTSLAFTTDGRPIVPTVKRGMVDVEADREFLDQLPGHRNGVFGLATLPDNKTALSLGGDGTIRMWEIATGRELAIVARYSGQPWAFTVSPDGKQFAVGTLTHAHAWRLNGRVAERYLYHPEGMHHATFTSAGDRLLTGRVWLRAWDTKTGKELLAFQPHEKSGFNALAVSPDGKTVATGSFDGAIHLTRLADRKILATLPTLNKDYRVTGIAFLPDGRSLVTTGENGTARLLELATMSERKRYTQRAMIARMDMAKDGSFLLFTGGYPRGSVCYWSLQNTDTEPMGYMDGIPLTFALTPDARHVLSGSRQGCLVWDVRRFINPPARPTQFSAAELEKRWHLLADADAGKAFAALCALAENRGAAVGVLREHLRAVPRATDQDIQRLLTQLDDEEVRRRQQAFASLAALGERARAAIDEGMKNPPSLEVRRQLRRLRDMLEKQNLTTDVLQSIRAVEALERIGSPAAVAVLKKLAAGEPKAHLTRQATASVERLQKR